MPAGGLRSSSVVTRREGNIDQCGTCGCGPEDSLKLKLKLKVWRHWKILKSSRDHDVDFDFGRG